MQVTGTIGTFITEALIKLGKHSITAITRQGGSTKAPDGVAVKSVNYEEEATITEALKGQDALVITMAATAPPEIQTKLINAAAAAGVQWIFPNEYGYGWDDSGAGKDTMLGTRYATSRKQIQDLGKNWIGISCGFWYEFSIASKAFGIDAENRKVTFIDDGTVKLTTTTYPQTGKAVANLLALKISSDRPDDKACLDHFKNGHVYFDSFHVSQKDMFDSVLRVTGGKTEDWSITHEPHEERFNNARQKLFSGDRSGFQPMLYTRTFYPDGAGDLTRQGLSNDVLGLEKLDLDTETKRAIQMPQPTYG